MLGRESIARPTIKPADAVNFVLQASGRPPEMLTIMLARSDASLITALRPSRMEMSMKTYEFKLIFRLPKSASDIDSMIEQLAEAGCDDAIVGAGSPGRLSLQFDREANSAVEAIESAIRNVKQGIPGATLIEAAPDLVGLTELSAVLGISRQAARKKMLSNADFPDPVHSGNPCLWHLIDLLAWTETNAKREVPIELKEVALKTFTLNLETEARRANLQVIPNPQATA
jgi:predicted DNA-binding transcriptional regulator AlpA